MLDHALVALIVLVAIAYTVWKLAPRSARRVVARRIARALQARAGVSPQRVVRIERRLADSACGACDTCGGCSEGTTRSAS